jgi:hypothetical protein
LIDSSLSNGGMVLIRITSNGEELSLEDTFLFKYNPIPKIDDVEPKLIFYDDPITPIIMRGENFYDTPTKTVYFSTLDKVITKTPVLVSDSEIRTEYVAGDFDIGDTLEIALSLDSDSYINGTNQISIYKRFTLVKVVPEYVSVNEVSKLSIILDLETSRLLWDTRQTLTWAFEGKTITTNAFSSPSGTLVTCDIPMKTTPQTIDVKIVVDETNDIESSNSLTFEYLEAGLIDSLSPTSFYYIPNKQMYATLTGTGFTNSPTNKLYVYIEGGQVLEVEAISDTEVSIPLPVMNIGSTFDTIYVSINKITFATKVLTSVGTVRRWPDGKYWTLTSETQWEAGDFWPLNQIGIPMDCGPGTVQKDAGQKEWDRCGVGKICPFGGIDEFDWPPGYLWFNETNRIERDMLQCPEGLVWEPTATDYLVSGDIGAAGKPKGWPDGFWWGEGVYQTMFKEGDMGTPQPCRDGVACTRGLGGTIDSAVFGSKDSHGNYPWPIQNFWQDGNVHPWPKAHKWHKQFMTSPDICKPGFYSKIDAADTCEPCPIGGICSYLGTSNPVKCPPGKTWQLSAQIIAPRLCPAGSYWELKTVTSRSNYTNIAEDYIPIYWYPGTYCLAGCETPIVDPTNSQAAQECIEGSYWIEGTDSPKGIPCPEGTYCPKQALEPIPTEPGYFAKGEGNVQQEPCPPGTFSNRTRVSECETWPAGYEWTGEATVTPSLCPAGTFKPLDELLIYCELCPQGTWSNQTGLYGEDQCTPWEPGIVCTLEGMTSLDLAIPCPEGYVCSEYKLQIFTLPNNPCPEGYYWGLRTISQDDFFLWRRGLYCPTATTSTGVSQNRWIPGYYWPLGTAAVMNAQGLFESVYQLEEGRIKELTDPAYPNCTENDALPYDLRDEYKDVDKKLICPDGTTSERSSWWLGHCKKLSSSTVVESINPVNGSETVDGHVDSFGEVQGDGTDPPSSRRLAVDPLYVDPYTYRLDPLYWAKIFFDLRGLSPQFIHNEHFKISIKTESGTELMNLNYFTASNDPLDTHRELEIRVHNMQSVVQEFKITIELMHGLFRPYLSHLRNKVFVFIYHSQRSRIGESTTFIILLSSTYHENVVMPYNAPDIGSDPDFFLDMTANVGLPPSRNYQKDVFDSTYWQSKEITSAFVTWFPFFSNCEGYDNRIIVYDVLEFNPKCNIPKKSDINVVYPIPTTGLYPKADKWDLNIRCRYDEPYNSKVENSIRWYEIKEDLPLFLMSRDPLSIEEIVEKDNEDNGFSQDIADGSDSLIEANFIPETKSVGYPRIVEFEILYYQVI